MKMAQPERKPALSGRALGLVLIFLTAIIWVAASFISQLLVSHAEGRPDFHVSPFLLTYLSTSIFTVFLPLVQLKSLLQETWLLRRSFKYKPLQDDEEALSLTSSRPTTTTTAATRTAAAAGGGDFDSSSSPDAAAAGGRGGLAADLDLAAAVAAAEAAAVAARESRAAHKEALTAAMQCFLFWFAAQFLFNQSLKLTSVTSNTILSSTSSLFTFALSMMFLKEPYSAAKLLSIAACMGGTLLVTLSDDSKITGGGGSSGNSSSSLAAAAAAIAANTTALPAAASPAPSATDSSSSSNHSVWGDLLCLVSASLYACYTIVLRKALPDDEEANVALFFGYVGLLCSVVFAPFVALLAGIGALHLKAIPPKAYLIILVQGILNYCLSDYLWAHAVLLLGPTIATLGLSVQIPVAAVVEAIIGHPKWLSSGAAMAMTLSGTGLIMVGFVAGNLAGGGHVYGSHHRDGVDSEQQLSSSYGGSTPGSISIDTSCPSPRHRRTAAEEEAAGGGGGGQRSPAGILARFNSSSDDEDDMPGSPLLSSGLNRQQGSSQFGGGSMGMGIPVSTHACIREQVPSLRGAVGPATVRGSSPGRVTGSPRAAVFPNRADAAASVVTTTAAGGAGSSPTRQKQQGGLNNSLELSSSFGSEGWGGHRSPLSRDQPAAEAGLKPKSGLSVMAAAAAAPVLAPGNTGVGADAAASAILAVAAAEEQQQSTLAAAAARGAGDRQPSSCVDHQPGHHQQQQQQQQQHQ